MDPALVFCVFWMYSGFVWWLKWCLYPHAAVVDPLPRAEWRPGQELAVVISPDYWWALRFKHRLDAAAPAGRKKELRKRFVESNNYLNLGFSLVLALLCLWLRAFAPDSLLFPVASTAAMIRLVSRSYEIAYAFGRDVFQTGKSSTGLNKHQRVRLALLSYLEIYAYSAAAYTALPTLKTAADAVTLSLNVGTLTNVGYAFGCNPAPFVVNIVFFQVITTLSLVVLSLAAYLGRKK
jgi:hypothetical protein